MNPRLKELFSNTLIFTIANFSSKILVFLMVPLYTAVLSTEEYGISDMVSTISGLLMPVLSLSISSAVLRFCFLKDYNHKEVYTVGHRITLWGTAVTVIVTALIYFFKVYPQLGIYIWFVPAQFLFGAYSSFLTNYTRGIGNVKISAIAGVVSTFTIVTSNLLLLLVFKMGILGYMVSFIIGPIVSIVVMYTSVKEKEGVKFGINHDLRNKMIKFSAPLIPNDLSWWAIDSFNRFFILSTLSVSSVGIYSASAKIPAILTALCTIFSQAWMLSALNGYGTEENTRFIRSVHKKMFSLLALLTAVFIISSKPLALLLLSGEFSSCWYMIPFLMVSVFMGAMVGFYGSIYSAERKNAMQFISTLGGAVVSILLMVFLLNKFGIIIAAISNMIGYIIIWVLRKEGVKRFIDIGMSTLNCFVSLILLVLESVAVSLSQWIIASVLLAILGIIHYKEMRSTLLYIELGVVKSINKRRNG